jgi:hypothetical protein
VGIAIAACVVGLGILAYVIIRTRFKRKSKKRPKAPIGLKNL